MRIVLWILFASSVFATAGASLTWLNSKAASLSISSELHHLENEVQDEQVHETRMRVRTRLDSLETGPKYAVFGSIAIMLLCITALVIEYRRTRKDE